jgi:hypothetical protein
VAHQGQSFIPLVIVGAAILVATVPQLLGAKPMQIVQEESLTPPGISPDTSTVTILIDGMMKSRSGST